LTYYDPDQLHSVLIAFTPVLKSIDVRTAVVCPSSGEELQNLITVIFLSDRTVDEIKAEQKQIPEVKNNYFRIFYDALPYKYSNFDRFFDGEISFPVLSSIQIPIKARKFNPLDLKVTSSQEWVNGLLSYPLKSADLGIEEDRKKLWETVYNQSGLAKRYGFPSIPELIKNYLKTEYTHGTRKDFEIVIPPLAQIQNLQFSENQLTVKVRKPPKLEGLQLNLLLQHDSRPRWRNTREIEETNNLKFSVNGMLPFDVLTVELIHRYSGLTLDRAYETVPLQNVSEPFVKTLDAFCSLEKIKKMLFEPEKYGKSPEKYLRMQ